MDLDLEKIINNNPTYLLKILADTNAVAFQNKIFENKDNSFFLQYTSTSYSPEAMIECYDFLLEHNYHISDINYNKIFNFQSVLKLKKDEKLIENSYVPDFLWLFAKNKDVLAHVIDSLNSTDIEKLKNYPILEMGFLNNNLNVIKKISKKGFNFLNSDCENKIKEILKDPFYKNVADFYWETKSQYNELMEQEQFEHFKEIFIKETNQINVRKDFYTKTILDWIQPKLNNNLTKEHKLELLKIALTISDTRILNTIKKSISFNPNEYSNFLINNLPLINVHEVILEPIVNNIKVLNEKENGWLNFLSFLKNKDITLNNGKAYTSGSQNKLATERSFFNKISQQIGYENLINQKVNNNNLFTHIIDLDPILYARIKPILNIDPMINGTLLSTKINKLKDDDYPILRDILEKTWLNKKENTNYFQLTQNCNNSFTILSHRILNQVLTVKEKEKFLPFLLDSIVSTIVNHNMSDWHEQIEDENENRFSKGVNIFKSLYLSLIHDETVSWKNIQFTEESMKRIKDTELYFDIKARTMYQELNNDNTITQSNKIKNNKNKL